MVRLHGLYSYVNIKCHHAPSRSMSTTDFTAACAAENSRRTSEMPNLSCVIPVPRGANVRYVAGQSAAQGADLAITLAAFPTPN